MFQENLLSGKRILVTGGGTGLGKSMATRFIELGAHVVICGRRTEVLEATCQEWNATRPNSSSYVACDVKDPEQVKAMTDTVWKTSPLDVVVNNAAGNFAAKTESLSHRAVDSVLGIVLHGTCYVTLEIGKRWLAENRKGNFLNIVTTYAACGSGSAFVVPSAMAKAGVLAMTRSLAVEWGGRGIRLNAIAPGPFPTEGAWSRLVPRADMANVFQDQNPLGRVGTHDELANLAVFLVSDFAGYINGECVVIDGGEWLKGAGQFNFLSRLTNEDWDAIKRGAKS